MNIRALHILLLIVIFTTFSCEKINPFDKRRKYVGEYSVVVYYNSSSWGAPYSSYSYETTVSIERDIKNSNNSSMFFYFNPANPGEPPYYTMSVYKNGDISGWNPDSQASEFHENSRVKIPFLFQLADIYIQELIGPGNMSERENKNIC